VGRNLHRKKGALTRRGKVYFLDAAHMLHAAIPSQGWIRRGHTIQLKTNSGRNRLTILGAYSPDERDLINLEGRESCDAERVAQLLQKIRAANPGKRLLIVLDNAPYNDDETKMVDATTLFACRQVANAIDIHQCMPPKFYTDNGPAFRKQFKQRLKEIGIELTNSIPGYPPGRGKIENFLKLLDKILKEIAGYVENATRDNMKEVLAHPIPTLEFFLEQVHAKIEQIRKSPPRKREKESRHDLWKNGKSYAISPPDQIKLVVFGNTVEQAKARVYDKGVYWKYVYYAPVKPSAELDLLWSRIVGKKIPFRIAVLRDKLVAFASFDDRTWVPVEPREESDRGTEEHMKFRGSNQKRIREANRVRVATLDTIMAGAHRGMSIDAFLEQQTQDKPKTPESSGINQGDQDLPMTDAGGNEAPAETHGKVEQNENKPLVSGPKRSKGFSVGLRQMFKQQPDGSET
jgi:hypothetical protein